MDLKSRDFALFHSLPNQGEGGIEWYSSVVRAFDFDAKVSEVKGEIKHVRFFTENISELYHLKCASNMICLYR
jgi:hypothetical protein